jgi:hypothetical protein
VVDAAAATPGGIAAERDAALEPVGFAHGDWMAALAATADQAATGTLLIGDRTPRSPRRARPCAPPAVRGVAKTPAPAPGASATAEHQTVSARRDCLNRMLIVGDLHAACPGRAPWP